MTNLILKEFRCVEETNEAGWDSPYFVIFIGHPGSTPISDVKTIRKDNWDNDIGSGNLKAPNITIASGVNENTLVLVALMEEDDNPDISDRALTDVKNRMGTIFSAYNASGSAGPAQMATKVKPEFIRALNVNIADDDLVGVKRLEITTLSGLLPLLDFHGQGGHYRVRFSMT